MMTKQTEGLSAEEDNILDYFTKQKTFNVLIKELKNLEREKQELVLTELAESAEKGRDVLLQSLGISEVIFALEKRKESFERKTDKNK